VTKHDGHLQGEDLEESLDIDVVSQGEDRASTLHQPHLKLARVERSRLLTSTGAPEKWHIGEASDSLETNCLLMLSHRVQIARRDAIPSW